MTRPRVAYDAPLSLLGVLGRFYPLIIPLLAFPIGTEIGAVRAHGDPTLGHALLPFLYSPLAGFTWAGSLSQAHTPAVEIAGDTFAFTLLIAVLATFFLMIVDFAHGRSWGPLNIVFIVLTVWNDFDTTLRGFPSTFTWWGSGGVVDREASGRSLRRKPPAP